MIPIASMPFANHLCRCAFEGGGHKVLFATGKDYRAKSILSHFKWKFLLAAMALSVISFAHAQNMQLPADMRAF
jgi:hypothetical protein